MIEPPKGFWMVWIPVEAILFLLHGYVFMFTDLPGTTVASLPAYYWVLVVGFVGMTLVGFVFGGPFSTKRQPNMVDGILLLVLGIMLTLLLPTANPYPNGVVVFTVAAGIACLLAGIISLAYKLRSR